MRKEPMMGRLIALVSLCWMPLVLAAEPCTTVDVTGWTEEQRVFFWANVSALAKNQVVKADGTTGEVCFADLTRPQDYPSMDLSRLAGQPPLDLSKITSENVLRTHDAQRPIRAGQADPAPSEEEAIKTKLGLTEADFQQLKRAMRR